MAMPANGFAWGPYEDAGFTVAMNFCTGFMLILLVPSLGYYFAFRAPFRFSRLTRVIIVAVCLALTVAGNVLYFVFAGKYLGMVSATMKIAPFLAEIGLIALYLIGFIRLSPDNITMKTYKERGNTWVDLLGKLFNGIRNILFKLLKIRHSSAFIIGGIVLFTLCLFVLMELIYVLLGIVAVLLIIAICSALYMPSQHTYQRYTVTDDSDTLRELSYSDYNNFTGEYFYKDDTGNTWATTNGGSTFYRVTDDNARHADESAEGNFIDYK